MSTTTQQPPTARTADKRLTIRRLFDQQRPELAKLLPRGMDMERLFRMALTECVKNPLLFECTAESWALSLQTCAQQGLYPDSGLGYMYLVPRKNRKKGVTEVSAMRGYQGDIKLVRNTGELADIWAEVVHAKDEYRVTKGLDRNLVHIPYDGDDDPGPLRATYAVAKLKNGEVNFVDLRRRDVERHRASSESWEQDWSPWQKHTEAMWKKTAIHELAKWLPKSSEAVEQALRKVLEEPVGSGKAIDVDAIDLGSVSVPVEPAAPGLDALADRLAPEASATPADEPAISCTAHPDIDLTEKDDCWKCEAERKDKAEASAPAAAAAPPENAKPAAAPTKPRQGRLQD